MTSTRIEWADEVWNPVTGCSKVSQGCKNCYAERIAGRFWKDRKFSDVQFHEDRLDAPSHWKKPRRVFVNSMSDLFHEKLNFSEILTVFYRMGIYDRHIYLVLTKRPQRMLEFFDYWKEHIDWCLANGNPFFKPPLRNIWLGVSVEDQKAADERIPLLLQTPAAVRFVSCEPLLGAVDLSGYLTGLYILGERPELTINEPSLNWVICGGESGPGARPMHPDWARSLRDQCQAAQVPFFFKQWGEWAPDCLCDTKKPHPETPRPHPGLIGCMFRCGKKAAGRLLDGREWNEYPEGGE